MLVFTDLPPPLGAMSLVWADVSLEAVNVSRKGASATKRFQNPSPSDLKTGAFPKQCHGPNTNSGTSPPLPGGERKELIFFFLVRLHRPAGSWDTVRDRGGTFLFLVEAVPVLQELGTYFNTTLSRKLLCIQQLSGHFLPPSKPVSFRFPQLPIHTPKLPYLAQNLGYDTALQP